MNKINTLLTGTIGTTAIELTNHLPTSDVDLQQSSVSLIIQIIIGIATLFKMFRKRKEV